MSPDIPGSENHPVPSGQTRQASPGLLGNTIWKSPAAECLKNTTIDPIALSQGDPGTECTALSKARLPASWAGWDFRS